MVLLYIIELGLLLMGVRDRNRAGTRLPEVSIASPPTMEMALPRGYAFRSWLVGRFSHQVAQTGR